MCRQVWPATILRMWFRSTPNSAANSTALECWWSAHLYRSRISRTASSVSFALPCLSPLAIDSGRVLFPFFSPVGARPFRFMSSWLSAGDPRNRCEGLTQSRLSHRWQTNIRSGSWPKWRNHEIRCALYILGYSRMTPYPAVVVVPFQSQHSSFLSTLDQKRSICFWLGVISMGRGRVSVKSGLQHRFGIAADAGSTHRPHHVSLSELYQISLDARLFGDEQTASSATTWPLETSGNSLFRTRCRTR